MTTIEERKLAVALGVLSGRLLDSIGQEEKALLEVDAWGYGENPSDDTCRSLAEEIVFRFIKEAMEK